MSVAPHSGIIDFGTFTPPATPLDGIQGEVPAPLVGQEGYILSASGWVPGGSISGLGTMSTQNADDVAITGGSINGTTIGATTASSGAFTTLSASSTVSGTGFSTYLASPPAIGGTAPAAGTFTTLIGGGGSANYAQITGGATTKAVQFQTIGTDTNISQVFQPKGTGAIDLAAGSSGVNISNGGTVTAITGTTAGSYTTTPTFTISAPTTSGGVQATGTVTMQLLSASSVASGGTGYTLNDVITLSGGTSTTTALVTVSAVSGGVVTGITLSNAGVYTVLPSNPISTTGGTGTGLTLTGAWGVRSGGFTITAAGSGYVEQPTITFSSGTAAAYATVGSGTVVRSLGSTLDFYTPGGIGLRVNDFAQSNINWVEINGSSGNVGIASNGSGTPSLAFKSKASSATAFTFGTNNSATIVQFAVAHTASAVNYVQVTGSATTAQPLISTQGSDTNISLSLTSKGSGNVNFWTNNSASRQFAVTHTTGTVVNYATVTGSATGAAPSFSVAGTDTDIALNLTTKGTGAVNFNTGTTSALQFQVADTASAVNYVQVSGGAVNNGPKVTFTGTDTNIAGVFVLKGASSFRFNTNNTIGTEQFRVLHTASSVNYVQVTGAATTGYPTISAQGSDANSGFYFQAKGTGSIRFSTSGANSNEQFRINNTTSAVNYLQATGSATGTSPAFSVAGTDTDIDLSLTPKGAGLVRFGTYTAGAPAATGYISIKAADGTTYKLLVST